MELLSIILLITTGIYFSFKIKFKNYSIIEMIKSINEKEIGISKFESLCISLASKIGVGSISGTALAIYTGGIGSIFWMWIITLLSSSNTFIETILSLKYRIKNEDEYIGGPFYYIKSFSKTLSIIYAIIFLISYIIGFIPIQVNTITSTINESLNISNFIIIIILLIMLIYGVVNGINNISKTLSKLMPITLIIYTLFCLIIILKNYLYIPKIIIEIISTAFNKKSFFSGFTIGCIKSLFSTECGLGTTAVASSCTTNINYKKSALSQTLGIYIDTFVVTTLTAFVIILSNYESLNITNINGIEIAFYSFNYHLGFIGNLILFISIILFALSTLLSSYYFIEVGFTYLFNNKIIPKIIFILIIIISNLFSSNIIWKFIDYSVIFLSIINIYSLLKLKKDVKS